MATITVNGQQREVKSSPDTPLIYVLRDELGVMGVKFGCGLAQCGACSVLLDGEEIRACVTPLAALEGKVVTTVDGLAARWARQKGVPVDPARLHPVQQAWVDEQVPQCGICQFGMMIKVTELLEHTPKPTDAQIAQALTESGPSPHLCRCGSYAAIRDGVHRAAVLMAQGAA
ncbi:2Fe-2S iron-sulfur cluster binding domain-containing protein [Novosphingobium sp. FSY-8]|uniref:2Fe-2S iron-sulfur cluster binding domain-containing protein n=1 Tax=Novosphingobium ovatum TaxID=1908523 RepID=A0ABW9XA83_9SPHN|nr:(2Fe-2S)-binding protein [Novosphingobium ovatum]NBC35444.1 2Fe-2S iron-sulfur cluster binding domain-containing protein [Novosphingobium ovatum]